MDPVLIIAILLLASSDPAAAQLPSLRKLAVPHNLFVGTCIGYGELTDKNYTTLGGQQFDLITPENEMKWGATEMQQNVFTFEQGDAVLAYAQANNQTVRGHNLCWGADNPNWLTNGHFSGPELLSILQNHIAHVAGHYNGDVYCWDVVNEAVTDSSDPNADPLKSTVWYPAVPDYIDQAFIAAHAADSNAKLFYNDYGAEGLGLKSQRVFNLVSNMTARGIPIHGVGLQMHVSTGYYPAFADVAANIKRLVALGLEVHITEMDVGTQDQSQQQLQLQASIFAGMLNVCLTTPGCKSYEMWGFTDKYSWLSSEHACIFDTGFQPKPAFYSLVQTLEG